MKTKCDPRHLEEDTSHEDKGRLVQEETIEKGKVRRHLLVVVIIIIRLICKAQYPGQLAKQLP